MNYTASYEAVDDRTVRWTGIPGYSDPELAGSFWTPLPEHVLGDVAPADLPQAEAARTMPIGWGPYVLERWTPGKSLEFSPNPNYHRRGEGLPAFDRLQARIIGEGTEAAIQQVLTGECDVLEESLLDGSTLETLAQLSGDQRLKSSATPGVLLERLDFQTAPAGDRPPILAEQGVRRALAACIDRQGVIDRAISGLSSIPSGVLTAGHPLDASVASSIVYDPAGGKAALTSLGWIDDDEQSATPRVAQGVVGLDDGTPLALSLRTASGPGEESVAQAIADGLAQCGVAVDVESLPAETLYAPFPQGPAFGRDFDLVLWPWLEMGHSGMRALHDGRDRFLGESRREQRQRFQRRRLRSRLRRGQTGSGRRDGLRRGDPRIAGNSGRRRSFAAAFPVAAPAGRRPGRLWAERRCDGGSVVEPGRA